MKRALPVFSVVLLMLAGVLSIAPFLSDADTEEGTIFLDMGDGNVMETYVSVNGTMGDAVSVAISENDLTGTLAGTATDNLDGISNGSGSSNCEWRFYKWEGEWVETAYDGAAAFVGGTFAWGFYPAGLTPVATPSVSDPWIMYRGDASGSGVQSSAGPESCGVKWTIQYDGEFINGGILAAGERIYFITGGTEKPNPLDPTEERDRAYPALHCADLDGNIIWFAQYPEIGLPWETATPLVLSDRVIVPASCGKIFMVDLDGKPIGTPVDIPRFDTGVPRKFMSGPGSLVYDSGFVYFGASDGRFYKMDTDGNIISSVQTGEAVYHAAPYIRTEADGTKTAFIGGWGGSIFAIDCATMTVEWEYDLYLDEEDPDKYGLFGSVTMGTGAYSNMIAVTYSDGAMSPLESGIAVFNLDTLDPSNPEPMWKDESFSAAGSPGVAYKNGFIISTSNGVSFYEWNNSEPLWMKDYGLVKGPLTMANDRVYLVQYQSNGSIIALSPESGSKLGEYAIEPATSKGFAMVGALIHGGNIYVGNDDGILYCFDSSVLPLIRGEPKPGGADTATIAIWSATFGMLALFVFYYIRFVKPSGEGMVASRKRKLFLMLAAGSLGSFIMFMLALSYGPGGNMSVGEALLNLASALGKGGEGLTAYESYIYESRLPRAMATFAVGIGLSVAGAVYQAIIRNPLVDPYITGVSSGAGLMAIVAIVFGTSLGVSYVTSIYLTPIVAMVGGLLAFVLTMLIAEKSGGSSLNYVLGGVVIGLAFSAFQSMILSMAGNQLQNAMFWLFGSFANVTWNNVWFIFIPALAMSFIPLFWAKELNLVLLGEEQARQMGLNVRSFNRWMMVLASVITSVCVAFVGIIGFVGLVVPHLCRMILGGDHRLVLPASIIMGGALMMAADLVARMIFVPFELPVGAITTLIGTPLFAYLLIKRGRMYNG